MGATQILPGSRHRFPLMRLIQIVFSVSLVSLFLVSAYIYRFHGNVARFVFSSRGCNVWLPPRHAGKLNDEQIAAQILFRDILDTPHVQSKNSKIAFMFLTPGSLPFEKLWDMFFRGHDGKFSLYIHASKEKAAHASRYFLNREIRSDEVLWGTISMIDAERRLLAHALKDADNQHFVLLSESCIPLHNFDYVYNYLMHVNMSFVDCYVDLGRYGNGRYSERMFPVVEKKDFRKGSQWFSMRRQHALIVVADNLYYSRFEDFCKSGFDATHCVADEHYLPTFFHINDPGGIANRSVTNVDWSEGKWHPKLYRAQDVTNELLMNISSIDSIVQATSATKPCMWNGIRRPCYLFARKFSPETVDKLMMLLNF